MARGNQRDKAREKTQKELASKVNLHYDSFETPLPASHTCKTYFSNFILTLTAEVEEHRTF